MTVPSDLEARIRQALSEIIDPELDCDIVSLGLVYEVAVEGDQARVTMTMTTPGCPISDLLPSGLNSTTKARPAI